MANIQFLAHNERVIVAPFEVQTTKFSYRPRGWVGSFSKFSKRRLMAIFYSFKVSPFKTFWTFTFDKDVKSEFAKKEINRLNMVFNRRGIGWLWCMEFTEKGRIHFHYALTDCLSVNWVSSIWGNGHVFVSKVFGESGLRKYFVKEVVKGNQKRFMGFNGRWWGVSRVLNKKYSLGVYDESFAVALADIRGIKHNYWREDLEGLIENSHSNFNNFHEVKKNLLTSPLD